LSNLGKSKKTMLKSVASASALFLPFQYSPSFAAGFDQNTIALTASTISGIFGISLSAYLFLRMRGERRSLQLTKRRLGDVEYQLNEAEAALQSESQILLTWNGNSKKPERMLGTLHGTVRVPETLDAIIEFESWLEHDAAKMLQGQLDQLHGNGTSFNFGVKTKLGDLLEVDGRAAGTMINLRFRPLSGERLESNESQYDSLKLTKQVERLSAILDVAPFPIWLTGKDGQLNWINQSYVKATEAPDSESVLRRNLQLTKPEGLDTSKANAEASLVGRAKAVLGGQMRSFNIHESALENGQVGFAIDVTPLEETEKDLGRHEAAHASMLDKLSTAIAIFGPDQRLTFHNQAYQELWELDEAFLKSNPSDGEILDRLRAARNLPEQANYREWRSKQLKNYTTLEPIEENWYLPDGRALRVITEQHPLGGVTHLYENLTKEFQLESRYNELFEVQRETLDNLAEAIALTGPDGRLKLYNPAFTRFWSLDTAFLEKKPHVNELAQLPVLSADSRSAWQDIKFGVTGLESNRKGQEGRVTQNGRVLRYRAVPLPDGNALLTFTDVSDAVKAEQALRDRAEALEAADRLKNSILSNVSYEVRTPLTSIIGFAETLEYGVAGTLTPKQREYIQDIRASSEDLKSIINAIIDLSAIDAGQMELKLAQVNVSDLLMATAEKFLPILEKRHLEISIDVAKDVTDILADPNRVEQIILHLLSNAAGFSSPESQIKMGARRQGSSVQIWVADSGRGIEPEFQQKVFDRFQAKPLPGSHRGPGLGLALVKSFTELHNGKVSLVSKMNHGTTVICTLPIAGPSKAGRFESASAA
jgi:signal transduction histidine kinase